MLHLPRSFHLEEKNSLSVEQIIPHFNQRRRLLDDPVSEAPIHYEALEAEAGPIVKIDREIRQPFRTLCKHFKQLLFDYPSQSFNLSRFCFIFKKWAIPDLFFFIFVFSVHLTVNVNINFCWWLHSNRGPLELEATALPTEPQPLPWFSFIILTKARVSTCQDLALLFLVSHVYVRSHHFLKRIYFALTSL